MTTEMARNPYRGHLAWAWDQGWLKANVEVSERRWMHAYAALEPSGETDEGS